MSAPPSITIDNVQVAKIEKNTMALSIKISGKNIDQKTIEMKALLDTGAGGKFIDQKISSKTRKSRQRTWSIPLKFLMWMELHIKEERSQNTPGWIDN